MKVIKFGGKSLANGTGIDNVISIIKSKIEQSEKFIVVLSARGNTTNELAEMLEKSKNGENYLSLFESFKTNQLLPVKGAEFDEEFNLLYKIFEGVNLVEDYSEKVKDLVLAQGEILAAKVIVEYLKREQVSANFVDSRTFLITDDAFGNARVQEEVSKKKAIENFKTTTDSSKILITTGFIASTPEGETTTIGRNGSNYSAALLAKFLRAEEFQNYTHVNGVYSANPDLVEDARILDEISYQEANELISFGASILHAKTIIPLIESAIPLRILNTFNPNGKGTLIHNKTKSASVKSISVQQDVAVINIEGKGLLGKTGIDARIFNALDRKEISIGVISQGSSERGVGLVVQETDSKKAIEALNNEFQVELRENDISTISALDNISVVTIVGQNLNGFAKAYEQLVKNNIEILLFNNTLSGNNISLVIQNDDVNKAVNVIHGRIFGIAKKINIAIFGKGTVGGSLIDQILESQGQILERKETKLNIFAVVGTQKISLNKAGIRQSWLADYEASPITNNGIQTVIDFAKEHHLENLVAIDNTASTTFIENYIPLIENGFDLISSNKIGNTIDFNFYKTLRKTLKANNKTYLYETNVGAGLPLIDTIKLLHDSGENITRIRGVFSGSLSYLFNNFSVKDVPFNVVLQEAIDKGFTEPDPREDLCGNDVARKLLILARELDLENEFDEIKIKNLIPAEFREKNVTEFLSDLQALNPYYKSTKEEQEAGHVLRYVGDLSGDLQQNKGVLEVDLVSVPETSALGQVKGSDSIFEIYTDSYGDNPIVIQGAGAGAAVTARGVFGDLLRIAEKK